MAIKTYGTNSPIVPIVASVPKSIAPAGSEAIVNGVVYVSDGKKWVTDKRYVLFSM